MLGDVVEPDEVELVSGLVRAVAKNSGCVQGILIRKLVTGHLSTISR